jgi:hypothetical protein
MWTQLTPGMPGHVVATFSYSTIGLGLLVTGALLAGGVWLVKTRKNWQGASICFFLAAVGGISVVPLLMRDRFVMTPTSAWQRTGFFWSPTVKGFDLAPGDSVALVMVEQPGHRGRVVRKPAVLVERKDGRMEMVHPGDLWQSHLDTMSECLKVGGFAVADRRGTGEVFGLETRRRGGSGN